MSPRDQRARGTLRYSKPALPHDALLDRMADRGLVISDADRTRRYLRHIGYYRFSPYMIPFRAEPTADTLNAGTTFDEVLDLYVFDRRLRLLLMDAIERVEVAVRSTLTDYMSLTYGGPFWYLDSRHFRDARRHTRLLSLVREACRKQLEDGAELSDGDYAHASALEHYLTTYRDPELPPSWLMVEMLTLGQLQQLVDNLKRISDVAKVAQPLGIGAPLLLSWLRTYVRVRNVCAHHGRMWNVGLGVYPALPTSPSVDWVDPEVFEISPGRKRRLYPVLVSLQCMMATLSPGSSWAQRLSHLLDAHPHVPLKGMGIPSNWREDDFWSARIGG